MKKRWMFFVLFCIATLSVAGHAEVVVERPTYSEGDSWVFVDAHGKETTWNFRKQEKEKYVFEKNGAEVMKDFNLMDISTAGSFPGPMVKFPLKKGAWWTYEYAVTSLTEGDKPYRNRYEAVDYEKITVAAGTFTAFRITVTIEALLRHKVGAKEVGSGTYWYAPDVKQVIKAEMKDRRWELKGYKIK